MYQSSDDIEASCSITKLNPRVDATTFLNYTNISIVEVLEYSSIINFNIKVCTWLAVIEEN